MRFGDLATDEFSDLKLMLTQWARCFRRNTLRERYYHGHNRLRDLGISIPPNLRHVETCVGWPQKAVDALASRSQFDGFVSSSSGRVDEVTELFSRNDFNLTYRQATTDELIHSCSFITLTGGALGEPKALLTANNAQTSTALWDVRRRRLRCGLTITDAREGRPTGMNLFLADSTVVIVYDGLRWNAERIPHHIGTPLMEVLAYRPTIR
jgi:hypothetical protein